MKRWLSLAPLALAFVFALCARGADTVAPAVSVVDGIVQPRRPVAEAIDDAIRFLRKADGAYRPGRIDGALAGYFLSAHVMPDGTGAPRRLAFPARQHAYFIRTFLHYYAYTGETEWLLRARDLADWNIAHSTPATAAYANLPYSAYENGQPTGSADKNSTEPDKAAFLGAGYLRVFESTGDVRYLDAARKIAATLLAHQRDDGSWPFRVIPEDGAIFQDLGGAPVFYVEFFEHLLRHENRPEYRRAADRATRLMLARNIERGEWGTYHEDIRPRDGTHLSAEPMSFTADYLFRHGREHPEYIEAGRRVLRQMEAALVHKTGHAAAPAPAVAEQATFAHIMPGHTARYCLALADLYAVNGDAAVRRDALSGLNAVTYMQSETGLFRTFFYDTRKKSDGAAGRPDWYSQHLYTVCHLFETMAVFPERVPAGQNHIIATTTALRDVSYATAVVRYSASARTAVWIKLSFTPTSVQLNHRPITSPDAADGDGWSFNSATGILVVAHSAGEIQITK